MNLIMWLINIVRQLLVWFSVCPLFLSEKKVKWILFFLANIIMLGHGCVVGWFTPSAPILLSEDTPLHSGPLTSDELSWLGSINNLGALGGILTFGYITSMWGAKRAMLFLALPSIVFWILIYLGDTYDHILFARFFSGWSGGGIQTTLVLFVSEISNDK